MSFQYKNIKKKSKSYIKFYSKKILLKPWDDSKTPLWNITKYFQSRSIFVLQVPPPFFRCCGKKSMTNKLSHRWWKISAYIPPKYFLKVEKKRLNFSWYFLGSSIFIPVWLKITFRALSPHPRPILIANIFVFKPISDGRARFFINFWSLLKFCPFFSTYIPMAVCRTRSPPP